MDKRYQVFLSSTFVDLQDERKEVLAALQKAGYFVAGMELFPSDDDESWEVIKRVIDQSDYYVLVIGGRYGTIGKKGKSFTEMEYDYAKKQGLPVLAFVHGDPESLPNKNVESANPEKLGNFKKKIEEQHTRRHWNNSHDLAMEVLASISQTVNLRPRIGWVRGDAATRNDELARRLDELQQRHAQILDERDALKRRIDDIQPEDSNFAWGDDLTDIELTIKRPDSGGLKHAEVETHITEVTWDFLFNTIGQNIFGWTLPWHIEGVLCNAVFPEHCERLHKTKPSPRLSIADENMLKIRDQLLALKLIEVMVPEGRGGGVLSSTEAWKLSPKGIHALASRNAIRTG